MCHLVHRAVRLRQIHTCFGSGK
ncbi:hypothetical protein GBAR_LOCUS25701 [Geodia barretti]|uniref:Uncharacterized protein n=1 Tax=Geodia barretti TaxID=519541 RepID=A0AA35TDS5_GEOBA|nr:hypothetical protein GBAR_LOCUS25701 [Geodia barretti]